MPFRYEAPGDTTKVYCSILSHHSVINIVLICHLRPVYDYSYGIENWLVFHYVNRRSIRVLFDDIVILLARVLYRLI
jgi:hypothetical protein